MNKVTEKQSKEIRKLAERTGEDIDTSELPEVDDFSGAVRGRLYRPVKQQITLRLDADLLAWFRSSHRSHGPTSPSGGLSVATAN